MEDGEGGKDYKKRVTEERKEKLKEKKIHGRDKRDLAMVTGRVYHKEHEGLHHGSSGAGFENTLVPSQKSKGRYKPKMQAFLWGRKNSVPSAGCPKLSKKPYKRRHDRMGLRVYWELCQKFGIECGDKLFAEITDTVRQSKDGQFEIWWDRPVENTIKLDHTTRSRPTF